MRLEEFSAVVDRCAFAAQALSEAVTGHDTNRIDQATQALSLRILEVQLALPHALPSLQAAEPHVREGWQARLAAILEPIKIAAELSTLNTAAASARLAALAQLSGAELSYSSSGQLSR